MTAKTGSRLAKPIRMKSEPSAMSQLSKAEDAELKQQVAKITSLLAWPGHQFDFESQRTALVQAARTIEDEGK